MGEKPNIQAGLYIRTNGGVITKITKLNSTGSVVCDKMPNVHQNCWPYGNKILTDFSQIKKMGKKPTDLIEVGDIITTNNLCGEVTKIDGDIIYTTCYDGETCHKDDIHSILTRELSARLRYTINNGG